MTAVTLAVTRRPQELDIPTPTIEEWQQEVLAGLAVRLADLTRVNRFQQEGLAELNAMAVPEEHKDLHADLVELWEAGIAWTDRWLVGTQDAIGGVQGESWGDVDVYTDEERAAYQKIHARHVDAWGRVDFVLLGTPQPPPYDIPGSATAWALTPPPPVPTATRGPAPTATPASTPERIKITKTYEIRRLNEGDKLSQEEAMYLHFKAWEKAAVMADAGKRCGINIEEFNPSSHHPPHVAELWYSASASFERYEEAGLFVVEAVAGRGADLNMRLSEENWAAINDLFVRFVIAEQKLGDNVERLLEAAECPN